MIITIRCLLRRIFALSIIIESFGDFLAIVYQAKLVLAEASCWSSSVRRESEGLISKRVSIASAITSVI